MGDRYLGLNKWMTLPVVREGAHAQDEADAQRGQQEEREESDGRDGSDESDESDESGVECLRP